MVKVFHKLLLLLITITSIYSQDYVEVFREYLSDQAFFNQRFRKSINLLINNYGERDPNLVFFYVMYLNDILKNNGQDSARYFENLYKSKSIESRFKLNNWAVNEKILLRKKAKTWTEYFDLKSFYRSYTNSEIRMYKRDVFETRSLENENKRFYIIYLYFTKKINQKYDPHKNYKDLVIRHLEFQIDKFTSAYNNQDNLSRENVDHIVEYSRKFLYLFKNSYIDNIEVELPFSHHEFLYRLNEDGFTDRLTISASIKQVISPNDIHYENTMSFTDKLNIVYNYEHKYFLSFTYINLRIEYLLRETISPFSHINLEFGYAPIATHTKLKGESADLAKGLKAKPGLYYDYHIRQENPKDLEGTSYIFELSTPVFFYNRNLRIDIGGAYILSKYKYKDIIFQDSEYFYRDEDGNSFEEIYYGYYPTEVSGSYHDFYPILSFKYNYFRNLSIKASYFAPKKFAVDLYYNFIILE
jgi:hypothetical protein